MLLGGTRYRTLGTNIGGASVLSSKFRIKEEEWFGVTRINEYAGYPQGYGGKSFAMPLTSGAISVREDISLTSSASGAMGVNAEGTASFELPVANASLELIVSGEGSTTFVITTEGNTTASLNGVASTTFSFSLNHLAMYLDAYGFATANLDLLTTGNGILKAIAVCGGSTVDTSGLTPASIWNYQDRTLTALDVEVSGLTVEQANQLNDIANNTGLIPALL